MTETPRFTSDSKSLFTIDMAGGKIQFRKNHVFTQAHLEELKKCFPEINVACDPTDDEGEIGIARLSTDDKLNVATDIKFFEMNKGLPIENLCSRLDNYVPQNISQENFLFWAKKLLALKGISSAGVFAYGSRGVGKTHISVGLAKEFLKRGEKPRYYNASTSPLLSVGKHEIEENSIWIVDDLNSPYSVARDLFVVILTRIHDKSGRLLVTSNMNYEEYMQKLRVSLGEVEFLRIEDRIEGMIKPVLVSGDSMRPQKAWFTR